MQPRLESVICYPRRRSSVSIALPPSRSAVRMGLLAALLSMTFATTALTETIDGLPAETALNSPPRRPSTDPARCRRWTRHRPVLTRQPQKNICKPISRAQSIPQFELGLLQNAQRFQLLGSANHLLIQYAAGEGQEASLTAGQPFKISVDLNKETIVTFHLQLLDSSNNPVKSAHWHLKLSGPMAQYAQIDQGAGRSQSSEVQFDTNSAAPAEVRWIFPAMSSADFLSALNGSPGSAADLRLIARRAHQRRPRLGNHEGQRFSKPRQPVA
jgi:hypothetical protein